MTDTTRRRFLGAVVGSLAGSAVSARDVFVDPESSTAMIGVAKVDITPDYPVRLSGFGRGGFFGTVSS